MPEGHTIARLAQQFTSVFVGEQLAASSPQGKFAPGAALVDGHVLRRAYAVGKQLFLEFEPALTVRVHLGLYGAWDFGGDSSFAGHSSIGAPRRVGKSESGDARVAYYACPPEPVGAVRLRLASQHGWADLRGPTACEVLTPEQVSAQLAKLGPDPLNSTTTYDGARGAARFVSGVQRTSTALGKLLMDQSVISGVGNVYRAEFLFMLGLNPDLPGKGVATATAQALWDLAAEYLRHGVHDGRIITTDPRLWHASGQELPGTLMSRDEAGRLVPASEVGKRKRWRVSGSFPTLENSRYVYKRTGEECWVCGAAVAMTEMAARKLYYCPGCQK